MALTSAYLVAVARLPQLLAAIQNAEAPQKFSQKFLEDLDFKSTNDRLFIGVLQGLGFLDPNRVPTQRYFNYLDKDESRRVLAEGIREAYEDLFRVNKKAHAMSHTQAKNKLKSLLQGKPSDSVLNNMAKTFVKLAENAEFKTPPPQPTVDGPDDLNGESDEPDNKTTDEPKPGPIVGSTNRNTGRLIDSLNYRIEISLPATRDRAIYDAIFRSMKDHLL